MIFLFSLYLPASRQVLDSVPARLALRTRMAGRPSENGHGRIEVIMYPFSNQYTIE